ncbi:AfsR/SARP family transcriptional regulator [Luteipulveratus flavus]|uniref:BTAD domain-containing putative transcriptional regulator n=1 Tax=Luteipulveratus flavus TaxID=3031728 RepID=A0ABT6CC39_9MICO|nr:BTAD domain-containing putative transcriptional regulator [Luteipulveratus sp. YIM 133296]MDF8265614.1 BTAD domain-containing putative transcriptional regulator [Luteipulveratus sp. YIM 133296]
MIGVRVMRIGVLGPVEVSDGAGWQRIGGTKCRAVLAALVAQTPSVVSIDALTDEVWGASPPKTASTQIHGYVLRLRRLLGDRDGRVLVTAPPGYRLAVPPGELDSEVMSTQLEEGASLLRAGHPSAAATVLTAALAQWRGQPYADVPQSALVHPSVERLRERRLALVEACFEAEIGAGRSREVIGAIRDHVGEHPLRELPWQQLMLALHHCGRQAEALQEYQRLRRVLRTELGVEPCAAVQELHRQILAGEVVDPAPDPRPSPRQPSTPTQAVFQLPADVADFTGRRGELGRLVDLASPADDTGPPSVVVVTGAPGTGKSALALHAARELTDRFPDGQLYLDLAGTSDAPREASALLAEILGSLGVSGRALPDEPAARSSLLRSLLADRRMLLLVDDAGSAEQVRPLIPPNGRSALVVTTRRLLTDLPAARHVPLDPLDPASAYELLGRIVGRERVAREPDAARDIVRACGYLPLSIRVAGGKLVGRPHWSLAVLRARLEDESRRLSELKLGDLDVRSSVDLSLRMLPDEACRAFGLLGLLGPNDLPGWVVGPLLDRDHADDVLDALVDANLVSLVSTDAHGQPRYRLHDLLRVRAVEWCRHLDTEELRAAVERVLATWLHLVEGARRSLPPSPFHPPRGPAVRRPLPAHTVTQHVTDPFSWLDAERGTLLAAVGLAADWGLSDAAWELAAGLSSYFDDRALLDDWRRSHEVALLATLDNRLAQAALLRGLSQVHLYRSELDDAARLAERSLRLYRSIGHRRGQATALAGLVSAHRICGRPSVAFELLNQALELADDTDRAFRAHLHCSGGMILLAQERHSEAWRWFRTALVMAREEGDAHREAIVLRELSVLQHRSGDSTAALVALAEALSILTRLEDERCVAFALGRRATIHVDLGAVDDACADLTRAAETFHRNGTFADEAVSRRELASLEARRGNGAAARAQLRRSAELWAATGNDREAAASELALQALSA